MSMSLEQFIRRHRVSLLLKQPNDATHINFYGIWSRKVTDDTDEDMLCRLKTERSQITQKWEGVIISQNFNNRAEVRDVKVNRLKEEDALLQLQAELAKIV